MKPYSHISPRMLQPYGYLPHYPALLSPVGDFEQWKLPKSFDYISKEGWLIQPPDDFFTDLASVPKVLRAIFGANGKESIGAVIHDYGYRCQMKYHLNILIGRRKRLVRHEWDEVFMM